LLKWLEYIHNKFGRRYILGVLISIVDYMNFNEKTRKNSARFAAFGILVLALGNTSIVNAQLVPRIVPAITAPAASNNSGNNAPGGSSSGASNKPANNNPASTPAVSGTAPNTATAPATPRALEGVYKTINDLIQQRIQRENSNNDTRQSSNNTQPENARPLRPQDDGTKKQENPVKVDDSKPFVKSTPPPAPKKNLMYQTLQTMIPTDPYIEKGFTPIVSDILYGISGIVAAAGILLLFGKPAFLARRVASLFTFA
jgi:hypothetical protein